MSWTIALVTAEGDLNLIQGESLTKAEATAIANDWTKNCNQIASPMLTEEVQSIWRTRATELIEQPKSWTALAIDMDSLDDIIEMGTDLTLSEVKLWLREVKKRPFMARYKVIYLPVF